ncbi:glycerol-3-phosphate responsive antiterminator, partial [Bacillus sp. WP8]|uniref:glycerol-3-phosphate responsive antiterminator n=1 Tax=Bacillus sp. WP8 TaxID=756828 RepID=UPI0021B26960
MDLGGVKGIMNEANADDKKMFVDVDVIDGMKDDEYGREFICEEMKGGGIICSRCCVIVKAKEKKVYGIEGMFLVDRSGMEKSMELVGKHGRD